MCRGAVLSESVGHRPRRCGHLGSERREVVDIPEGGNPDQIHLLAELLDRMGVLTMCHDDHCAVRETGKSGCVGNTEERRRIDDHEIVDI